jgi:hypothetical protein
VEVVSPLSRRRTESRQVSGVGLGLGTPGPLTPDAVLSKPGIVGISRSPLQCEARNGLCRSGRRRICLYDSGLASL